MQLRICEFAGLGRHLIHFAVVDHGHNGVLTPSMQPDIVSEVGRTQGLIALSINTVACSTCPKFRFTQRCFQRIVGAARQTKHIVGQMANIFRRTHRSGQGRHLTHTAFEQRLLNFLVRSAMQPIVIGQIGKALATARIRAMTLSAVVHEEPVANGHGLRVFGYFFGRHGRKFGVKGLQLFVGLGHFCIILAGGSPI